MRIGPNVLVTNRHNVADEPSVTIHLYDGKSITGLVVPTGYDGDLVLVHASGLPEGPIAKIATDLNAERYYTIGYDLNRRRVWAYQPGELIALPAEGKPLARLHHTAYTQPGNSGGALVNGSGELVGIATSGGAGRFEAIPATALKRLQDQSGLMFAVNSKTLGAAYRQCLLALEDRSKDRAAKLEATCPATGNRQLLDQTAQALGLIRQFDASLKQSRQSVAKDPNAVNALIILAQTLNFSGKPALAVPHVERLLELTPKDDRIHALAATTAAASLNDKLLQRALALTEKHKPERLPFMKKLVERVQSRNR